MVMLNITKRQNKILEMLTKEKKIEVVYLSNILGVSQVTIRKDLIQLENSGLIIREHGYATLNSNDDVNSRLAHFYETKQKIAKKAATLISDGETIMIESGSCCALIALEIAQTKKEVTLITNSAFIADYIRKNGSIRIILLGGEYQKESQVMVGPMTQKCVESFFVDKLFIGTDGFSRGIGFTGNDYLRSDTVKHMAKQASKVFIATDSSKFHQKGVVSLLPLQQIYSVITDSQIPPQEEQYLQQQGVIIEKVEI